MCLWNDIIMLYLSHGLYSVLIFRWTSFLYATGFTPTPCFAPYSVLLLSLFNYLKLWNILCLTVVIIRGYRTKKAGANSEKETWLNCTIQPFSRAFFDAISSLHLIASNDSKMFLFCKIFMKTWQLISSILCINEDNSTFLGNKITNSWNL